MCSPCNDYNKAIAAISTNTTTATYATISNIHSTSTNNYRLHLKKSISISCASSGIPIV